MKRKTGNKISGIIIFAALCMGAPLASAGNAIVVGEFSIQSTPQKSGGLKIEIRKNKQPFQEISTDWGDCTANFLFTEVLDNAKDKIFLGVVCDFEYSAVEYTYDAAKDKAFTYAGPMEWLTINELRETKGHFIGLDHSSVNHEKVLIFAKPSNSHQDNQQFLAKKDGEYIFHINPEHCNGSCLKIGDYNFDGHEDFSLFSTHDRQGREERKYFLYDKNKNGFFASTFEGADLEFDSKTKTIWQTSGHAVNHGAMEMHTTYKVVNNRMKKIKEGCNLGYNDGMTMAIFEHDCSDGYSGGFSALGSSGLKNNFEVFVALSGSGTKGVVLYKGKTEFITLSLSTKNGADWTYDEIYKGKKNGKYMFTMNEGAIASGSYTSKNGKKFRLQTLSKDD
ncbi:MAG: hypothetical protein LBP52_00885 [Burkholderiaceae bacterium]|nr:hypothetical protein [Burkholderiaceae bacterium]